MAVWAKASLQPARPAQEDAREGGQRRPGPGSGPAAGPQVAIATENKGHGGQGLLSGLPFHLFHSEPESLPLLLTIRQAG